MSEKLHFSKIANGEKRIATIEFFDDKLEEILFGGFHYTSEARLVFTGFVDDENGPMTSEVPYQSKSSALQDLVQWATNAQKDGWKFIAKPWQMEYKLEE